MEMRRNKAVLILTCVLVLAILACGVSVDLGTAPSPVPTQPLSSQNQLGTIVAQTLQALTQQAASATPTHTATPTNTATSTNTPVPPTLSVSASTDCYAGPGTRYGRVITIYPGNTVTVVGKDTADNYWIINVPNYPGTVCWLSGQYASVGGATNDLPVPATPIVSNYTLDEPRALRFSCSSEPLSGTPEPWWHNPSEWTVVLHWVNTDPDQIAVRLYRNNRHIATLGAHANSYTDVFLHNRHWDVTYGVQAVNSAEVSSIVTIEVDHCG
jgi:hypothetical protein